MLASSRLASTLAALLGLAVVQTVHAGVGGLTDLEIYDRSAGRTLPVYWHDGRHYVSGEPGHEYELRLRSRDGGRVLAVTSVDGVNVVTGQTASPTQGGYVLDPYGAQSIAGWRKSMSRTAAFYFTALPDSYAARTGRPHDVGVIGVAVFREAPQYRHYGDEAEIARQAPSEPGAPAASTPEAAADSASPRLRSEGYAGARPPARERLGTGHGRSEWSSATYTQFQRVSGTPDEVITIYYDSQANLIAQGIVPAPSWPPSPHRPRAFPVGFVPDP